MPTIRFLGQSCFEFKHEEITVVTDPFLTGNPLAAASADELEPTHLFLSHGHQDHYGDIVDIAKRTGAEVVALTEVAGELSGKGVENVKDPNLGGTVDYDWGWVKMVPAWHTSTTPDGTVCTPAGMVIEIGGKTIYHLGDTALFSDLKLIQRRHPIDVALVPIGGHYTMDRWDAVTAVEFVGANRVIPCHYNTFPPIEADAEAFKAEVDEKTPSECVVLAPGESYDVP
jgi:L-ascorbate metabolism protein UlaG (beta-lactamase superfamily)